MDNRIARRAEMIIDRLKSTASREAAETRVASMILIKIIRHYTGLGGPRPTQKELKFLGQHSADLLRLIPMVVMLPTPIPYIEIALILKAVGFGYLVPTDKALDTPYDTDKPVEKNIPEKHEEA
jgi:hypothetical protein